MALHGTQVLTSNLDNWTMGQLYNERKSDDGFLYAHYSGENSFGGF
ncbi:unnamed protein product [Hydatigera taeniaeformis]|uniref:Fibrinogen C-terminal domain-containing protein n=1 Tax=Hydatigena taeniaeformis TaxID=6205 RepID=A0A0R3WWH2_HYDTA|nr:unnamed protein product [Hydatigera taeniaeformis]